MPSEDCIAFDKKCPFFVNNRKSPSLKDKNGQFLPWLFHTVFLKKTVNQFEPLILKFRMMQYNDTIQIKEKHKVAVIPYIPKSEKNDVCEILDQFDGDKTFMDKDNSDWWSIRTSIIQYWKNLLETAIENSWIVYR
eukprot:UN04721